jgi:hypothetical protein
LADFGVTGGTGGGDGDLLRVADELDVVMVAFVFGIALDVEAVGEDGVILGFDEDADDVDEEGRVVLAEVLAFSALIVVEGVGGRAGVAVEGLGEGALALTGCAWSKMNPSAVVTVYQLNLNSGTVSGSPMRSQ